MTEERFANRIRQGLNHSLDELSPSALRRLEAARHHALAHQKQSVRQLSLAGATATANLGFDFMHSDRMRQVLAVLALLIGMAIAFSWQAHQYVSDLEELDSAVLTDSVPPEAFLDKGFAAWLDDSSED